MILPFALALLTAPPTVEDTLRTYAEATRTYDLAALERVLHPDYVEVSPLGEVDERARVLSFYRTKPPVLPASVLIDELKLRYPARDVAVAIYRTTFVVGTARPTFRASVVLRRERGRWQMYSLQATAIRPVSPKSRSAPGS